MNNDKKLLVEQVVSVYAKFATQYNVDGVFLSKLHLSFAIDNALIDLKRMKDFHFRDDEKIPDRHKYAGFVAKWIAKVKPIQFSCESPLNLRTDQQLYLNASFAVHVMMAFLKYKIPLNIAYNLRYWFTFRDERGETLAMVAYCCEEISCKNDS